MPDEHIKALINKGRPVRIVSGEGDIGHVEPYTGVRTIRAIKLRLECERLGGERWARASVYSHESEKYGSVWVDIETGDYC
jgi:hypothetical protein